MTSGPRGDEAEVLRRRGSESSPAYQLDHDYLARGMLRVEADADRWRALLARRAGFREVETRFLNRPAERLVEPDEVARILDVPLPWSLVAYLCVGYPERSHDVPELERAGWQARDSDSGYLIER